MKNYFCLPFFFVAILGLAGQNLKVFNSTIENHNLNLFLKSKEFLNHPLLTKVDSDGSIDLSGDKKLKIQDLLTLLGRGNSASIFKLERKSQSQFDSCKYYLFYQHYFNGIKVEGSSVLLTIINDGKNSRLVRLMPHVLSPDVESHINHRAKANLSKIKKANPKWSVLHGELVYSNKYNNKFDLYWKIKIFDSSYKLVYTSAENGGVYGVYDNNVMINGDTRNYGNVNLKDSNFDGKTYMKTPDNRISLFQEVNIIPPVNPGSFIPSKIPNTINTQTWNFDAWKHSIQSFFTIEKVDKVFREELGINFVTIKIGTTKGENAYSFDFYPITQRNVAHLLVGITNANDESSPNYALYDVLAHELGHSYLFNFLDYQEGLQSNILHEGLADIFGTYAEKFILGSTDWVQGGEDAVIKDSIDRDHKIFACLTDPNLDSAHKKSRAISHWFYKVSTSPEFTIDECYEIFREAINMIHYRQAGVYTFKYNTLQIASTNYGGPNSVKYNIIKNAWEAVCVTEPCPTQSDIEIKNEETYKNFSLGGNIIIRNGGKLSISGQNFMLRDKFIKVENGGILYLKNGSIDVCDGSNGTDLWKGIIVEQGGTVIIDYFGILSANEGITCQSSAIKINYELTIEGNPLLSTGIVVKGHPNFNFNSQTDSKCTVKNCWKGLSVTSGGVTSLEKITFVDCNTGATVDSNSFLYLSGCKVLGNFTTGVQSFGSEVILSDCTIGSVTERGSNGVYGLNSNIGVNDCHVYSSARCINTVFSFVSVYGNTFDVAGDANEYYRATGCILHGANDERSEISNNYMIVNNVKYGIATKYSNPSDISNNKINFTAPDVYASYRIPAAIAIGGGVGGNISANEVLGDPALDGIRIQNSMGNEMTCNHIYYTKEGISIRYNADLHTIKANTLNAAKDLIIRSEVGQQIHHGNVFLGGTAEAIDLNDQEIFRSTFFVNSSYSHQMPVNVSPPEWFVGQDGTPSDCSGIIIGPDWDNPPMRLCQYYAHLKTLRDSLPNRFFTSLYHLLRYEMKKPGFRLPDCIKNDSAYWQICGLMDIVRLTRATDTTGVQKIGSDTLRTLVATYSTARDSVTRAHINNSIGQLWAQISATRTINARQDSVILDSLTHIVPAINCQSPIVSMWKDALLILLRYKLAGFIAHADKARAEEISRSCADEWGDVVHLSRALVSTYSDRDYATFDDCREDVRFRSADYRAAHTLSVSPNPTTGILDIHLPSSSGTLYVTSMDGRLLLTQVVSSSNHHSLDLSPYKGINILSFRADTGETYRVKAMVTD